MAARPTSRPTVKTPFLIYILFAVFATALVGEYYYLLEPAGPNAAPAAGGALEDQMMSGMLSGLGSYFQSSGIYLRALVVMGALVLVFAQKPPGPQPGKPRRKPMEPEMAQRVVLISGLAGTLAALALLTVQAWNPAFIEIGYPLAVTAVLLSGFMAGQVRAMSKRPKFGLFSERKRRDTPYGISLPTANGGWVNVPNPFRGTLVLGGAGAGKSYSIGEPLIEQFAEKGFAGLIYDFKFPVLAEYVQKALIVSQARAQAAGRAWRPLSYHVVNFKDMERTEKVNPLKAANMPVQAYALEYSKAILTNLNPGQAAKADGFFEASANALLTGIIWFYRNNYPAFCTIPHVVNTALYANYEHVLAMLETDPESADLVRSIVSAVESGAEKQVAGVVASLQIALTRINTPEIVWVLTPDESRGEGFDLDLNNPDAPKLLCIGNDPTLKESFSPVIACIISVALKLMNQQKKHPSYVFLDEAATVYVPGLEVIPATARSNKVAMIYMTQDLAQMTDAYGKEKMQVMVSNLNNQFFGKVNSLETAKFVSELVGREDQEMMSLSAGQSSGSGKMGGGGSLNASVSLQERNVVRLQDTVTLEQGEFIGQTVETDEPFFQARILRKNAMPGDYPLQPMATFDYGTAAPPLPEAAAVEALSDTSNWLDKRRQLRMQAIRQTPQTALESIVRANFDLVREDVAHIVESYPNRFAKSPASAGDVY